MRWNFDFLVKIDGHILDLFEVLSHKIQSSFGWNNFQLAKVSLILGFIAALSSGIKFIQFLYFLAALIAIVSISAEENLYNRISDVPYVNQLRLRLTSIVGRLTISSLMFFNFSIAFIFELFAFWLLTFVFIWATIYFEACTPRPPGTSKFRKFLKSTFSKGLDPATNPS